MKKLTTNKTNGLNRTLGAIAVMASALSSPATANPDERYEDYEPHHPRPGIIYQENRVYEEDQPFRVYVTIRSTDDDSEFSDRYIDRNDHRYDNRRSDRRRDPRSHRRADRHDDWQVNWQADANPYHSITMAKLAHKLPPDILLVGSPTYADLVVKVRETDFDLNFRVTDIDQRDKKYKKNRRYTGGRCGVYHRAFYTRVEEKGSAYASFSVKYHLKGLETHRDDFRLKASEKFRYGQNLTASTNCGVRPTHHAPNDNVGKLFNQAHPEYRHHVAEEIRSEAAEKLARKLARDIKEGANRFHASAGGYHEHDGYHENDYGYNDSDRDHTRKVAALIARIILD